MRDATAGIVSDLTLMNLRIQLTTGDFRASEKQLQAFAKAAVELNRITDEGVDAAARRLQKGAIGGADKVLRQLGLDVDLGKITDKTAKSAEFVRLLEERFGGASIGAANMNEKVDQMSNALERAVGQLGTAIIKTRAFQSASNKLAEAAQGAALALDTAFQKRKAISDLEKQIGRLQVRLRDKTPIRTYADFLDRVAQGSLTAAQAGERLNEAIAKRNHLQRVAATIAKAQAAAKQKADDDALLRRRGMMGGRPRKKKAKGRAAAAGAGSGDAFTEAPEDLAQSFDQRIQSDIRATQVIRERQAAEESLQAAEIRRQMTLDEQHQQTLAIWARQDRARDESTAKVIDFERAVAKSKAAQAKWDVQTQAFSRSLQGLAVGALSNFAGAAISAADASIQSGDSFGMAMANVTKQILLQVGIEAGIMALKYTAMGFGLQATTLGIPNPGSISAFTAAGMYAAIAAGGIGGGLAISAATAGGGGAGARASGSGGGSARGLPRDDAVFGQRREQERKVVVNVFLGNRGDKSAKAWMTKQLEAELAS
jgi:hypothetical protein